MLRRLAKWLLLLGLVVSAAVVAVSYRAASDYRKHIASQKRSAEEAAKSAKKAQPRRLSPEDRAAALAGLTKKHDKFENITWYSHPNSPEAVDRKAVYAYIGVQDERAWLRLRVQHAGSRWLLADKVIFLSDGQRAGELEGRFKIGGGERHWEYLDVAMDTVQLPLMLFLAHANTVEVRIAGSEGVSDRELSAKELNALRAIFKAYTTLDPNGAGAKELLALN